MQFIRNLLPATLTTQITTPPSNLISSSAPTSLQSPYHSPSSTIQHYPQPSTIQNSALDLSIAILLLTAFPILGILPLLAFADPAAAVLNNPGFNFSQTPLSTTVLSHNTVIKDGPTPGEPGAAPRPGEPGAAPRPGDVGAAPRPGEQGALPRPADSGSWSGDNGGVEVRRPNHGGPHSSISATLTVPFTILTACFMTWGPWITILLVGTFASFGTVLATPVGRSVEAELESAAFRFMFWGFVVLLVLAVLGVVHEIWVFKKWWKVVSEHNRKHPAWTLHHP